MVETVRSLEATVRTLSSKQEAMERELRELHAEKAGYQSPLLEVKLDASEKPDEADDQNDVFEARDNLYGMVKRRGCTPARPKSDASPHAPQARDANKLPHPRPTLCCQLPHTHVSHRSALSLWPIFRRSP